MKYISHDDAVNLARKTGFVQHNGWLQDSTKEEIERLCNAAIEHYIENAVTELTGLPYITPERLKEAEERGQVLADFFSLNVPKTDFARLLDVSVDIKLK